MPGSLLNGGVERIRTSAPVTQPNDLANRPLQPLEYHSVSRCQPLLRFHPATGNILAGFVRPVNNFFVDRHNTPCQNIRFTWGIDISKAAMNKTHLNKSMTNEKARLESRTLNSYGRGSKN